MHRRKEEEREGAGKASVWSSISDLLCSALIIPLLRRSSPNFDREFVVNVRSREIGGFEVMFERRLKIAEDPNQRTEAQRLLKELETERLAILARLGPDDRRIFSNNVILGRREAEECFREDDA